MSYVECTVNPCGNPVFSKGLCRKHYEEGRLATAAPCSVEGCSAKSFRAKMCEPHYRKQLITLRPLCIIPNCGDHQKNLTSGLCARHEFRMRRHNNVESPRAADWGSREKHPLYSIWAYHKRIPNNLCEEWKTDFWGFVEIVIAKPVNHTLRKIDSTKPLSPTNWVWKPSVSSADKAAYQRTWRKHNPERAKNHNLKRHFGITLATYEAMALAQNNVCAICKNPETTKDKDGGPREMPVDHCHVTGKVRGLLCSNCNRGLGFFLDSPELLQQAISYLKQHSV